MCFRLYPSHLNPKKLTQEQSKERVLFILLGAFFLTNAILAEFIGVKIFSLEKSIGFAPLSLQILGIPNLSFNMTTGVLLWPFVFIVSDLINEYFGRKGVQLLSYLAAGMIVYAFIMVWIGIQLSPADFWRVDSVTGMNMNLAFQKIFGQGLWIICGSLVAFLIGQFVDVMVFHYFRSKTGGNYIWLRATGSTLVSQFIDSFVVLFIAFYIGANWSLEQVGAIAIVNYIYKFSVAILLTPVLYAVHYMIDNYLGHELAQHLTTQAAQTSRISLYLTDKKT